VQSRSLPVIMAGHGLDNLQLSIAAWGSFLVVPPWQRSDYGNRDVINLGKKKLYSTRSAF